MNTYLVSVNRGRPFEILAADSLTAWEMAFAAHPEPARVEVRRPVCGHVKPSEGRFNCAGDRYIMPRCHQCGN